MINIKEKNGISMIVLVITIVVMVILAAAVIFTLGKENPVQDASKAQIVSDIDAFKSDLVLYISKQDIQDEDFYADSLDGTTGEELENMLPSLKGKTRGTTSYSNLLTIKNGELALKEGFEEYVDEKTETILKEILSVADSDSEVDIY